MELSQEMLELIAKLAAENNETAEAMIIRLVKALDEERHSQWNPGEGQIRVKCQSRRCFEKRHRPKPGYGD